MKFSILIPVYNVEKYLKECIDSVLCQTYDDFEVILVDDGSTDSSGKICDEYAKKDSRVKVVHKENQGQLSSRLVGVELAEGEYCIFVDSDDMIKQESLKIIDEYIEKYNADIVLYSFVYYDGKNTKSRNKTLFPDGYILEGERKKELYESYLRGPDYYALWTKCIKSVLLKSDMTEYKGYYSMRMSEDVLQSFYPITNAEKIVFADKDLYIYRYNPNSVSNTMNCNDIARKDISRFYLLMKDYLKQWDINDDKHISIIENSQFGYAMYTFAQYYKNVPKKDRRKVVDFDWNSFIADGFSYEMSDGETAKKLYTMIKNKDYLGIEWFFFKESVYKKLRGR